MVEPITTNNSACTKPTSHHQERAFLYEIRGGVPSRWYGHTFSTCKKSNIPPQEKSYLGKIGLFFSTNSNHRKHSRVLLFTRILQEDPREEFPSKTIHKPSKLYKLNTLKRMGFVVPSILVGNERRNSFN